MRNFRQFVDLRVGIMIEFALYIAESLASVSPNSVSFYPNGFQQTKIRKPRHLKNAQLSPHGLLFLHRANQHRVESHSLTEPMLGISGVRRVQLCTTPKPGTDGVR